LGKIRNFEANIQQMAIMHQFNYKHAIGFILIGAIALSTALINPGKNKNEPAADVKALDAKLLVDLRNQDINIDTKTKCLMECQTIKESELKSLFDINNVNYAKCEAGNCHLSSYTIEGQLENGSQVSFKLDAGEDGNMLRELTVSKADCDC